MKPQMPPAMVPDHERERQVDDRRQTGINSGGEAGGQAAHDHLPLNADIEEPGPGRHGERQATQDERGGHHQGLGDRPLTPERALEERLVGGDRIVPRERDHHTASSQRDGNCKQRGEQRRNAGKQALPE